MSTMNYTTTRNEEKNITRHDWTLNGYTLTVAKYENRSNLITIKAPLDAPELCVDDFREAPVVEVNWSAIGSVNSDEARDYAAKIVAAAEVADRFQDIIDLLK